MGKARRVSRASNERERYWGGWDPLELPVGAYQEAYVLWSEFYFGHETELELVDWIRSPGGRKALARCFLLEAVELYLQGLESGSQGG